MLNSPTPVLLLSAGTNTVSKLPLSVPADNNNTYSVCLNVCSVQSYSQSFPLLVCCVMPCPLRRRPFPATERGRVAPALFSVTPVANVPPSTQPLTNTACFACRGASPCRSRLVPSRSRPGALAGKFRIAKLFSYPVSPFIPPVRKVAFVAPFYSADALPCAPPAPHLYNIY